MLNENDFIITKFETNEITMEKFFDMILKNGYDYTIEQSDDSEYIIVLNNLNKVVQISGGSSSGSEFVYLELMP